MFRVSFISSENRHPSFHVQPVVLIVLIVVAYAIVSEIDQCSCDCFWLRVPTSKCQVYRFDPSEKKKVEMSSLWRLNELLIWSLSLSTLLCCFQVKWLDKVIRWNRLIRLCQSRSWKLHFWTFEPNSMTYPIWYRRGKTPSSQRCYYALEIVNQLLSITHYVAYLCLMYTVVNQNSCRCLCAVKKRERLYTHLSMCTDSQVCAPAQHTGASLNGKRKHIQGSFFLLRLRLLLSFLLSAFAYAAVSV